MSAVAIEEREDRQLDGLTRLRLAGPLFDARRLVHAQAAGTLVLRVNAIVCRALEETGTITAFALSNGSGM